MPAVGSGAREEENKAGGTTEAQPEPLRGDQADMAAAASAASAPDLLMEGSLEKRVRPIHCLP